MSKEKLILAYSGGLDTSVAIAWLKEKYDVVAVCMDVGEGKDLDFIHDKALMVGAVESFVIDVKDQFAEEFVLPALQAHAFYEQKYPLISALSRPLISQKLVEIAHQTNASLIAHGCTGKGNDQVRFEVAIAALDPDIKVIAPVREWKWSREEEINFAKENGVPVPADLDSPYSIDQNLWGRANECGVLENPWNQAPEEAFGITTSPEKAPNEPEFVDITFKAGKPIAINGQDMPLANLILELNKIAGAHGVGRIDHVENRLVGIKSREIYECPGAITLLTAHKEIEDITLVRELSHFKPILENEISNLIYNGLWFNPATDAIKAYIKQTQKNVNGIAKVKLYKGSAQVVARQSSNSLYDENLATYTAADSFDQDAAIGFIKLWGLPTQVNAQVNQINNKE
ncbi:argininosuccinate synthase [Streptococcus parauberis]|uniref:Argininosuccinate synthase n=1 Tax=Streptococcus parauberis KRS-02083 TaxID=1207545 RepID=A0ABN0IQG6_9STRE|nr:argininosuccinate synthase [Streptococcus parauberis]AUT04952.1 Argininosuccinate synthase [Streptococcus parauberis]EMF48619.1 Argininosuccinate synthase [Streptococcus parauberis KRS-02109]EMG25043.1 Argininosuccinate synthase [Streptococcus parauberis KRS-02083]MDT2749694.1 argininosuccinate synthase [Streptococcus parauberis]OHY31019.1 argininosuccinate synthase [Streptococcus parauberis]